MKPSVVIICGGGPTPGINTMIPPRLVMPTGGVLPTEENLRGWFKAGVTCVGMGSKLISKEIIKNKDFNGLETKVKDCLALIKSIRNE